jgi:putative hemolysin
MATGYCRAKRMRTNAFALRYAVFVKTFRAYVTSATVVDTFPESVDSNKTLVLANSLA